MTLSNDLDMPRRGGFPFVKFFLAVLLVGVGIAVYKYKFSGSSTVEFLSETVEKGSIKATVSATGALEALTTVTVGSQVSGPVKQVLVDFNSPVRVGQVLAILDPSQFEANLREAQASMEITLADVESRRAAVQNARVGLDKARVSIDKSHATLTTLNAAIATSRANLASTEAQIKRSKAEMDVALLEYQRYEQLFSRQLVAASERDQKRTAYRVAAASYEASIATRQASLANVQQAEANLESARNDVRSAEAVLQGNLSDLNAAQASLASAEGRVKQQEASIAKVQVDLTRTKIVSPVAGTVIERKVEPGQNVVASYQVPDLFKIAKDLHQMQVKADVSEADIGRIEVGQPVSFTVDAYPDEKFKGSVNQVRAAPTAQSGSNNVVVYGVIISAPNPKLQLRPGMTATVAIETKELKDVILVPDAALRFLPPKPPDMKEEKKRREREKSKQSREEKDKKVGRPGVVWVESPQGPERRDVFLGVGDGKYTEITGGPLKVGEKVYTKVLDDGKRAQMNIKL